MKARLFVALALTGVVLIGGCVAQKPPSTLSIPSVTAGDTLNPKLAIASSYEREAFSVILASPTYSLPIALEEVTNLLG